MTKKTNVKSHIRKTPSGRTNVVRHQRTLSEKRKEEGQSVFYASGNDPPVEFNRGDSMWGMKRVSDGYDFHVMRAGSESSDDFRGGTWYEVEKWEGQKSSYQVGDGKRGITGVGGREVHRKVEHLDRPYWFEWKEGTEGRVVLDLSEKVLGKEQTQKMKRGITGHKAEESYARIERALSKKLKNEGYDGIVLYKNLAGKESPCYYPDQVFKFKEGE